ncbi:MAG: pilus assembly protein TadG-related protein, partial [Tepidiformaceae bacterium]
MMLRRIFQSIHNRAQGQALVLFAAGLIAFLGLVGMSVDVGRFVWARTQIQAAVDASALAAAQSMPSTSDATTKANEYWVDNSGFIQSSGRNVQFNVTFPPGNKALHVAASAEVDTFFLKFVGLPTWNVQAEGDAASQVLDVSLVL